MKEFFQAIGIVTSTLLGVALILGIFAFVCESLDTSKEVKQLLERVSYLEAKVYPLDDCDCHATTNKP